MKNCLKRDSNSVSESIRVNASRRFWKTASHPHFILKATEAPTKQLPAADSETRRVKGR